MPLPPAETQIYISAVHRANHPALLAQYQSLLNPEEAAQAARFVFDKHRHRYLLTRALVRTTLSRYHPELAPHAWRFETNAYGCPHLAQPPLELADLRFNLSHTDDMVVLALRRQGAVGIDIESAQRSANLEIADHFFTAQEAQHLRHLPSPSAQRGHFMALWTLKESYIKARTRGLSIPLNQCGFTLVSLHASNVGGPARDAGAGQGANRSDTRRYREDLQRSHAPASPQDNRHLRREETLPTPGRIEAHFDPMLGDDPQRWEFLQWQAPGEHLIALCLEKRHALGPPLVQLYEAVPLCSAPQPITWPLLRSSVNAS
jgi:phosphopantetheinyl transferase